MRYVEGMCPECGRRVAAAIDCGDDRFVRDVGEFMIAGMNVAVRDLDRNVVELEHHAVGCQLHTNAVRRDGK